MRRLTQSGLRVRNRRGAVLIWTTVLLTFMMLMASLAVDFARITLVRAELQHAVDSAARVGAAALPANLATVRSAVTAAGAKNTALGAPVQINPAGVQVVSLNDGSNNAVRVSADVSVPFMFGYLQSSQFEVTASATARRQPGGQPYGIVGIQGMTITGSGFVDSYDSSAGAYASTKSSSTSIASNGDISLSGASQVRGDAFSHGGTVSSASKLTGSVQPLDAPLNYPPESATTTSPGGNWSSGYGTLPAGTYFFHDLKLNPPQTLSTTGPVTIYVSGELSIKGKLLPQGNNPANLRIVVTSNEDVELTATAEVYAQIYAPLSDITFTGNSAFFGGVVGKTVTITGNADVHHDLAVPTSGSGGLGKAVVLVE